MADINRQLKNAFDEGKSYSDSDRFYADEMYFTLRSTYFLNPLLLLHLVSSKFGTSWIRSAIFIILLGLIKVVLTRDMHLMTISETVKNIIDSINPYINFKEAGNHMEPLHLIYLIFLSYGIYQFILSVRRISKR